MKHFNRIALGLGLLVAQAALAADTGQLPCKTTKECNEAAASIGANAPRGDAQAHTSPTDAALFGGAGGRGTSKRTTPLSQIALFRSANELRGIEIDGGPHVGPRSRGWRSSHLQRWSFAAPAPCTS